MREIYDNPIYEDYQRFVRQVLQREDPYPILKADCFNEAYTTYPIVPKLCDQWICIERDQKAIELAREYGYADLDIIRGDIRYLDFLDQHFSTVIDLSTIDHVEEYKQVLSGYWRVLKYGGYLLLVVWLDEEFRRVKNQWYFDRKGFEDTISIFNILEREELVGVVGGDGTLVRYLCRKEKNERGRNKRK